MRTLVLVLMFILIMLIASALGFPGKATGIILGGTILLGVIGKTVIKLLRSYVVLVSPDPIEITDVVRANEYTSTQQCEEGIGQVSVITVHAKADKYGDVTLIVPPGFAAED